MSWTSWIGQRIGLYGDRSNRFWASWVGGGRSTAGQIVTPQRAMAVMAFWRGVRLKAMTVASLPFLTYRLGAGPNDYTLDRENEYDAVARMSPNEYQTAVEFWEGMVASQVIFGDGLARKLMVGGRLVALEPLDSCRSAPFRNSQGALRYRGYDWQGNFYKDLAPEEVFHLKGFSLGGDCGMSAIQYGAGTLGLAMAANQVASDAFATGLTSSGFLETGQVLNEEDRERLEGVMAKYQANTNPGKMMILEGGFKFNKLGMTAADAQLLMTMGWGVEEIARLLDMPPILLGHSSDGQTMFGTGVEAVTQMWYTLGLRADLTRIESAWLKRVIAPKDQGRYALKVDVDDLLRGDSQSRALVAATLAQNGLENRDELRARNGKGAIPGGGGKLFTAQVNLSPLDKLGQSSGGATGQPVDAAIRNLIESEIARVTAELRMRRAA